MLAISKNLVWPRDLESFKGGKFNTLSLVDCNVQPNITTALKGECLKISGFTRNILGNILLP
jgi:hypothetical protein